MGKFTLTRKARADLEEIARFTWSRWGREQGVRYLTLLDDCFRQLGETPLLGRDCGDIRRGYRKLPVGGHVIYYRQLPGSTVEIVRILHGSMDVEGRL
jgi:toxin ParE1/3/4